MPQQFDEYGIPIKTSKGQVEEQSFDEFGIPIKKKEETPSTSGGAYVRPLSQGGGEPAQSIYEPSQTATTQVGLTKGGIRGKSDAQIMAERRADAIANVRREQEKANASGQYYGTDIVGITKPKEEAKGTAFGRNLDLYNKERVEKEKLVESVGATQTTPPKETKQKEIEKPIFEKISSFTTDLFGGINRAITNAPADVIKTGAELINYGGNVINKSLGLKSTKIEDNPVYQLADSYTNWMDNNVYQDVDKESMPSQIGSGLGQVLTMIGTGGASAGAKIATTGLKTGLKNAEKIKNAVKGSYLPFSQTFNSEYEQLKEAGESEDVSIVQAAENAFAAIPLEKFPIDNLVKRYTKNIGSDFTKRAINAIAQALEEGSTEALQQVISNLSNNQLVELDKNTKEWNKDVGNSAEVGGIVGLIIGTISGVAQGRLKKKLNIKEDPVSPPMESEAPPPAEGGAPPTTPPVGGTDIAVEETLEDKKAKAGESLRNLLGKVATEEKTVTPQGEEPLVEGNTPEEIATNIQVKLNDIKTQRAKILGGLPKDENGKRIKNDEAQAQLDDLEEQEFRLQEYDSQNKQRVSGEVGEGQKPIETQPVGAGSEEAVAPSGVFQAPTQEVIIPDTPAGHVTAVMDNPTADNVQNLADNAVSLAQEVIKQGNDQGTIPQEKMPTLEKTPPVGKELKAEMPKVEAPIAEVAVAEAPKVETTDALKDVESTAKALEGKTAGLLKEPTLEQKIQDLKNKNISTFRYEKDSDVPFVLKDKISSRSETNGKKIINVTLSKSEANYLLNKDNPQYISEEYHADKAAGKETELTKAVEQLLGKPISDVQGEGKRSILGSDVDLKGKKKEGWMKLLDEWYNDKLASEGEQTTNEVQKFSDMLPKNPHEFASLKQHKDLPIVKDIIEHQKTVKNNILKINNAISEGSMTAQDAKTIIESAGLEVPKNILEMAKKESKSTSTTGQKASTETISKGWDKDVESTAKALEGVSEKFTNTPSFKNAEIVLLRDAKLSAIEETKAIEAIDENNQNDSWEKVLRKGVRNLGNGWFSVGKTTKGESILYSPKKNKSVVLKGAKSDAIAVQDFVKNNFGNPKKTAEAYHADKTAGKETELTKAVEELLGKPTEAPKVEAKPSEVTKEPAPQKESVVGKEVEKPSNWSKERLDKEIEKLDPYESQGYGLARNKSLKESMADFPDKARLAFEAMYFFKKVYKEFEKSFEKTPLSSLSNFFYANVKSLKDYVDNQISAIEKNIKSNEEYIAGLGKSKSDQKSKEIFADTIEKLKNEIERLNAEYENYEKEKGAVSEGNKEATDFGKVISASSRFRPAETVFFDKPIIGKNGNKLISYQWAYEWTMQFGKDTELKSKRISDWTQAESSAETGRDIVHKFTVEKKDGTIVTVSSETIPSLLGYVDAKEMKNLPSVVSSVKTLAKQRMQLAILEAQEKEYNDLKSKYEKEKKPNIEVVKMTLENAPIALRRAISEGRVDRTIFKMGDVSTTQNNPYTYDSKTGQVIFSENNNPSRSTIEDLESSWVQARIKEDGGKYPNGIYDLRRRVERQEKKVEQATGSKLKTIEQSLKETPKAETIEDKKAKAGESLRNLLGKTGVIKNIVPSEDSDTWNDIKNIADYIAAETGKKGKELIEAIKKYLKTNGGEAIIPQIETYEKRIIAESSQEGVETTEPTNIRIFEELDAMNEKRMGIGNRAKENKAFNEKHGNKAQLARDITNNFEKYIDKLKEEGIIVKVKC